MPTVPNASVNPAKASVTGIYPEVEACRQVITVSSQ